MQNTTSKNKFKKALTESLPFTPNDQQNQALHKIADFVFSDNSNEVFLLKGFAGTGKTNLISAVTKSLPVIKMRSLLLAPTGRAAKVLSNTSKTPAFTIHKKIFRKDVSGEGRALFYLSENLHKNTLFVVDEASMISSNNDNSLSEHNLLESLFEYVFSGENCKLMLVGDTAQLPPVGSEDSPALNTDYLKRNYHLTVNTVELTEVVRQKSESGILFNATRLRESLEEDNFVLPKLEETFDVVDLKGEDLQDTLQSAYSEYGQEGVLIVTRSNKRANLFNQNVRNRILLFEEDVCSGDRIMVVKNNYFWLKDDQKNSEFIANGDMTEITKIIKREKLYGFNFIEANLRLIDFEDSPEITAKIIIDSLYTDTTSLSNDQQKMLYEEVMLDINDVPEKWKKLNYLRQNPYFNALQVKFSYAVTCHKSQGGQWPCVFIDHGYLTDEMMDKNFIRWLYTALTRATSKIYLVNFSKELLFH